jgi:hypothetical protein
MNAPRPHYWFPANRNGRDWRMPRCWQGWAVVAIYVFAIAVLMPFIVMHAGKSYAVVFAAGITALLLYVFHKKGEPRGKHWKD